MGKKKKIKTPSINKLSDAELVQKGDRAIGGGKWKDAIATYKELKKRHPDQYADQLWIAYTGRYRAFLENGMLDSAEQLLVSLQKQFPPERFIDFKLQLALVRGNQSAVETLVWESIKQSRAGGKAPTIDLLEKLIFSDSLPPEELTDDIEVKTLQSIRAGLRAICERDSQEQVTQAMAQISRRSVLAHWKLILGALNAWYSNQDDKLIKFLLATKNVDETGRRVVESLSLLAGLLTGYTSESLTDVSVMNGWESRSLPLLLEADMLVGKGKSEDAFDSITGKVASKVLSLEAQASVTAFFLTRFFDRDDFFGRNIEYELESLDEYDAKLFPFVRARFSRWWIDWDYPSDIDEFGSRYLNILKEKGEPPAVLAYARRHIAEKLVAVYDDDPRDPAPLESSAELLQESMRLDTADTESGLILFEVLELLKKTSAANKLLDTMAREHPDNARILQLAGKRCISRGTFVRGLKQLKQALQLDPHGQSIKEDYIIALFKVAEAEYLKGNLDKGRAHLEAIAPYLIDRSSPLDLILDRRMFQLRQLIMEEYHGEDASIQSKLKLSIQVSWEGEADFGQAVEYSLRAMSIKEDKLIEHKIKTFFERSELLDSLLPEHVLDLLKISRSLALGAETPLRIAWDQAFIEFIPKYLLNYSEDRLERILPIIWNSIPNYLSQQEVIDICKLWSKADRHHPQLKMLVLLAKVESGRLKPRLATVELDNAIEIAEQRNDQFALKKGKDLMKQFDNPFFAPFFEADLDDDFDDDCDFGYQDDQPRASSGQTEFEFDSTVESSDNPLTPMGHDDVLDRSIDEFADAWKSADASERKAMEQEARSIMGDVAGKQFIRMIKKRR